MLLQHQGEWCNVGHVEINGNSFLSRRELKHRNQNLKIEKETNQKKKNTKKSYKKK